jgi:hypothetical protein
MTNKAGGSPTANIQQNQQTIHIQADNTVNPAAFDYNDSLEE